jgi:hypothetical protein
MVSKYKKRFKCPCCGYPTLDEQGLYGICKICNWEDDGQDDSNANIVLGGPNGEYSLTQARNNFKQYFIMYSPEKDMRFTGSDTLEQVNLKEELCRCYISLMSTDDEEEIKKVDKEISNLEKMLRKTVSERIKQYEKSIEKK